MTIITGLQVLDIRFPTSIDRDGSDAMNPDPDYSAAYCILETDRPELAGHGLIDGSGLLFTPYCIRTSTFAPSIPFTDILKSVGNVGSEKSVSL